jgi:hypothetical protein
MRRLILSGKCRREAEAAGSSSEGHHTGVVGTSVNPGSTDRQRHPGSDLELIPI